LESLARSGAFVVLRNAAVQRTSLMKRIALVKASNGVIQVIDRVLIP
jgi:uncharacterized surface protein with fasciclin (FAS1) repeats